MLLLTYVPLPSIGQTIGYTAMLPSADDATAREEWSDNRFFAPALAEKEQARERALALCGRAAFDNVLYRPCVIVSASKRSATVQYRNGKEKTVALARLTID